MQILDVIFSTSPNHLQTQADCKPCFEVDVLSMLREIGDKECRAPNFGDDFIINFVGVFLVADEHRLKTCTAYAFVDAIFVNPFHFIVEAHRDECLTRRGSPCAQLVGGNKALGHQSPFSSRTQFV
jgi:hypothetical protein